MIHRLEKYPQSTFREGHLYLSIFTQSCCRNHLGGLGLCTNYLLRMNPVGLFSQLGHSCLGLILLMFDLLTYFVDMNIDRVLFGRAYNNHPN
jgi:hypothetical protein